MRRHGRQPSAAPLARVNGRGTVDLCHPFRFLPHQRAGRRTWQHLRVHDLHRPGPGYCTERARQFLLYAGGASGALQHANRASGRGVFRTIAVRDASVGASLLLAGPASGLHERGSIAIRTKLETNVRGAAG